MPIFTGCLPVSAKANDALAAHPGVSIRKLADGMSMRDGRRPTVGGDPRANTSDRTATRLEALATRVVDGACDRPIAALELPCTCSSISNAGASP
jgi:hypothetical protein